MNNNPPLETHEAQEFASWLTRQGVDFWNINQETYTTSWKQKRKNKAEGVRKGVSDFLIFLPSNQTKCKKAVLVWIELKRCKRRLKNGELGASPSTVSPDQLNFISLMTKVENVDGCVSYGAVEASDRIRGLLDLA